MLQNSIKEVKIASASLILVFFLRSRKTFQRCKVSSPPDLWYLRKRSVTIETTEDLNVKAGNTLIIQGWKDKH